MNFLRQPIYLLRISRTHGILRRYFVVNGFDGALTMLGLILGFIIGEPEKTSLVIDACLGAAIALAVSGVSSAYISESAERKRELDKLEQSMVADLADSAHGEAARWVPLLVGLVNGLAPLSISLLILSPLWVSMAGIPLPVNPLYAAIIIAFGIVFMLGMLLGKVANISWLKSGAQTLLIAIITVALVYLFVS